MGGKNHLPPHPSLLPPGEKELFTPSPLRGEGWGEGVLITLSNPHKRSTYAISS
jgi:hypothetical protein